MSWRTNTILLAIAVGLSVYSWFFENTAAPWHRVGRVFRDLETREIAEIRIARPADASAASVGAEVRPIVLRYEEYGKLPPGWWIVEPFRVRGSHPRVQGIVFSITDLDRVAEVVDEEVDPFGGEPPVAIIEFRTHEGEEHRIEVGQDHPDPQLDFTYVRVDGDAFITKKEFRKLTQATLNDLRSRALVPIPPDKALSVDVRGPPEAARSLARDGETPRWRIREPIAALADREVVQTLLSELNAWTVEQFVSDAATPSELAASGLDDPRLLVTARGASGFEVTIGVGNEAERPSDAEGPARLVHVRDMSAPFIYLAERKVVEILLIPIEEYRSRYVFDLGLEEVIGFRVELAAATAGQPDGIECRRLEVDSGSTAWRVTDLASGTSRPGDHRLLSGIAQQLRRLRVERFLDADDAIDAPWGRLLVSTSGGRELELVLGPRSSDPLDEGLDLYRVARSGEPGPFLVVLRLEAMVREGLDTFRQRDVSELDPASVREIELRAGADTFELARFSDRWAPSTRTPLREGRRFNFALVDDLLELLSAREFRVERFVSGADLAKHGLERSGAQRAVIFTRFADGETPASFHALLIGEPSDAEKAGSGPKWMARALGGDELPPFTIGQRYVTAFDALVAHLREATLPRQE